jgi:hypothetical protein
MGAAYVIMGNNGQGLFPAPDPTGDPTTWTRDELRRWLAVVSRIWLHPTSRLLTITEEFVSGREYHSRGALGKSSGKHAHPARVNLAEDGFNGYVYGSTTTSRSSRISNLNIIYLV